MLYQKKKIFSFEELFEICTKKLGLSQSEILESFTYLRENKLVVEGSRLIKEEILNNNTRFEIYQFITEYPGYHFTKIISSANVGPNAGRWHLNVLEKFNFVRHKKIEKYIVYFHYDFPESRDHMIHLLRNKNAFKIYERLISNPEITIRILEKHLNLHYNTIHYYINKLAKIGLIEEIQGDRERTYRIKESHLVFLERYFRFEAPPISIVKRPEEAETPSTQNITVLREYDYLGGDIRFKVAVQNKSIHTVSKIQVMLTSSEQYLVDEKVKTIDVLLPNESRGVDFMLTPLTCGKSNIYATVSYSDSKGTPQSLTVRPKEIWIKCPLVVPQHASISEVMTWKKELLNGSSSIEYSNIPESQAFKIALDQISALDLSAINLDESKK
ncbi:MAG: winged helix-turn-helix transcriptional regulator, partial [Candidatus Helarchaeota archaeon]